MEANGFSVYLGLKTGWTFGASLFGSIFGYAILKPLSKALPTYLGGGYFGPKENVCCEWFFGIVLCFWKTLCFTLIFHIFSIRSSKHGIVAFTEVNQSQR